MANGFVIQRVKSIESEMAHGKVLGSSLLSVTFIASHTQYLPRVGSGIITRCGLLT
jgi:hypothetical protein